jgi:biopolymer transport protein ExbD
MKNVFTACLVGLIWIAGAEAQGMPKPALQKGVSVEMAVASHAVEMRAADEQGATVVAITADGNVFVGVRPTELTELSGLSAGTVYVKADSRVQYQKILAALDALRGKPVVLLTAPPQNVAKRKMGPPYGIKLTVDR